jgi:hypothetical protein
MHPGSDSASTPTTSRTTALGTLRAHTGTNRAARTKVVRFTAPDVQVGATWGARESMVDDVLATVTTSPTSATSATRDARTAAGATTDTSSSPSAAPASSGTTTVANLLVGRLTSAGTVTVVNHSAGTVHLIADVTGYLR